MEKSQPVKDARSEHEHRMLVVDVKEEICTEQTSQTFSDIEHGVVNNASQEETGDANSGSDDQVDMPNPETLTKGVYCVKMCFCFLIGTLEI